MSKTEDAAVASTRAGGGQKFPLVNSRTSGMLAPMVTHVATNTNAKHLAKIEAALAQLAAETLRRGFFGSASIEFHVQDGTIQKIRRQVERIEK